MSGLLMPALQAQSLPAVGPPPVPAALIVLAAALLTAALGYALIRRSVRRRVAAERLAAMGMATARILHQVKNPLQSLLLHAELLEAEALQADASARVEISGAITSEALRMADLLAELSAYASGAARKVRPEPAPLHELIADVVRTRPVANGPLLSLVTSEPVVVPLDVHYFRQALENVVRNACEAAHEAGGASGRVTVALRRRGPEAVVEVSDDGPGIESARLRTVLEPFVTTKPKGMGLGLPVCRDIVRAHGGRLELRSEPGRGTTVILGIPLPEEPAPVRDVVPAAVPAGA